MLVGALREAGAKLAAVGEGCGRLAGPPHPAVAAMCETSDGQLALLFRDGCIRVLEAFPPATWLRRRLLLMCLNRGVEGAPPADAAGDVLLHMAALPEALWRGALIFQYL